MLRQELDLPILNDESVLLEVDNGLMPLEHVETKEKIDVATLRSALFPGVQARDDERTSRMSRLQER